jgi:phospholipase D1/2
MSNQQDNPAYGEEYDQSRGADGQGDRGIVGDTFRFLKERYKQSQQPQQAYGYGQQQTGPGGQAYNVGPQSGQQQPYGQGYSANQPPPGQTSYVRSHLL